MLYAIIGIYFVFLLIISYFASRKSNLQDYFNGSHKANWVIISFGMISDLLSGVTYVSVPGHVAISGISYLFVALGYVFGNIFIAYFIIPHFYKEKIISIYEILTEKLGKEATVICSILFLISRSFGASARLFLSLTILYQFLGLSQWINFPWLCVLVIGIIYVYTIKGGIKSLISTDIYHSALLLAGFFSVLYFLSQSVEFSTVLREVSIPLDNYQDSSYFLKSFFGGIFITLAMYGLDQNMMQKNLSCPNTISAKKNILLTTFFSLILNCCFIVLGLYILPNYKNFSLTLPLNLTGTINSDQLLIQIIQQVAPEWVMIVFILGLLAATFSSSDGVITTLTTSFYRDLLPVQFHKTFPVKTIHGLMALLLIIQLLLFALTNSSSMITIILKFSGYIYAPLIGIFLLYLLKTNKPKASTLSYSSMLTLVLSYPIISTLEQYSNYRFGNEVLIFNTILFLALFYCFKHFMRIIIYLNSSK